MCFVVALSESDSTSDESVENVPIRLSRGPAMDLHGRLEGQVSVLLVKEGMFVCGVSQPFVSVRSYQHSGSVVVAVTRMPDTACPSRNSTVQVSFWLRMSI